jgi:hypothetical protein
MTFVSIKYAYGLRVALSLPIFVLLVLVHSSTMAASGNGQWVATLLEPPDKAAERTAAEELGNASINGTLDLTEDERSGLETYILRCFARAKAQTPEERLEARRQIERLWHSAVPTLLKQLENKDPTQLELAIKSLLLMRNEAIIEALIDRGLSTQDVETRKWIVFTLGKMNDPREALVAERNCLSTEKSAEVFERLVKPALAQLTRKGSDK